jgi:hypothetical protein
MDPADNFANERISFLLLYSFLLLFPRQKTGKVTVPGKLRPFNLHHRKGRSPTKNTEMKNG